MPNEKKPSAKRQMRHKEKKHQKQKYNRSFARRLTRWVMLLLFVMMSGLGYIIYGMSKSIVVDYSVNTFHTNMQASARFFSSVMSDVSEAVKNHLYEVERNVGRQAEMQQAIARILQLNPRIRKCTVTGVDDPGSSSLMRLAADSDSAFGRHRSSTTATTTYPSWHTFSPYMTARGMSQQYSAQRCRSTS